MGKGRKRVLITVQLSSEQYALIARQARHKNTSVRQMLTELAQGFTGAFVEWLPLPPMETNGFFEEKARQKVVASKFPPSHTRANFLRSPYLRANNPKRLDLHENENKKPSLAILKRNEKNLPITISEDRFQKLLAATEELGRKDAHLVEP